MRSLLIFVAIAGLAATPTIAATRTFGASGFDRIRVDGPFKVSVTTGVAPFATVSGSSAAIDGVAIAVQGRTLIVRGSQAAWGGFPGAARGPVEIKIGTHELTQAWLNGSGSLTIDRIKGLSFDLAAQGSGSIAIREAAVDQLKIGLSGSANARVAGVAPKLTAVVRGISSLDASGLAVKDATIGADGAVTLSAAVSNSAKIDAQGTATVTLTGRPACTVRATGSASVNGCR